MSAIGLLQERCCRSEAAARLRAARGLLELEGDLLVGARCCAGSMPGAAVRVLVGVCCFGERTMHAAAVVGGAARYAADRTSGCANSTRLRELQQPRIDGRVGSGHVDLEHLGGTKEQRRVAERFCGRGEDEQLSVGGELEDASHVALLDPAADVLTVGEPESACKIRGAPGSRQLEERERVPVALRDDLVADRGI